MPPPDPPDRDAPDDAELPPRRPTAAERRQHRRTYPHGVRALDTEQPAWRDEDERDLSWPEPTLRDRELVQRAGRDLEPPVMPAELSAIVHGLRRELIEQLRREHRDALDRRVTPLERDFDPVRRVAKWAVGIAATAIVAVIAFAYARGAAEQHVTDELQYLRAQVNEIKGHHPSQTGTTP